MKISSPPDHVSQVLQRLRQHHLCAKAEKCDFNKTTIQFLGLKISNSGLEIDSENVSAVLDWPVPSSQKEVQRFLGFANFYRLFIQNFSKAVRPITDLTCSKVWFQWSSMAQFPFEDLKKHFTTVLAHPDPRSSFILEVDASESVLGVILSQRFGEKQV
ncbi:uncharacterized protein PAF06_000638 [Gastrophryne carolinensis]